MRKYVGGLYSGSIIRDIYPELREVESSSSITHPAGSLTEIYTYTLLHALPTGIQDLASLMYVCAFRFLLLHSHRALFLSIFAKDRNVQLLAKANHYFVPFHTNTFYAYFHTFISSSLHFLTLLSG